MVQSKSGGKDGEFHISQRPSRRAAHRTGGRSAFVVERTHQRDKRNRRWSAGPKKRGGRLARGVHRGPLARRFGLHGAHGRPLPRGDAGTYAYPHSSGAPGGLRHPLGLRLHQRPRSVRNRAPFEALDRGLGCVLRRGDHNRVPYPTRDLMETPSMSRMIVALFAGALFGVGLAVSGMTNPAKIVGFLDVAGEWDPTLMFVMGGALLVTFPTFRLSLRRQHPLLADGFALPTETALDGRLLGGAALFGVGWG